MWSFLIGVEIKGIADVINIKPEYLWLMIENFKIQSWLHEFPYCRQWVA